MQLLNVITFLLVSSLALADSVTYSESEVIALVPTQTDKGWWHKQFSSMEGNRYLTSFKSKEHVGKLKWDREDLKQGKIQIVKAMKLAQQWCVNNAPFGEKNWEIENVTYRFRAAGNNDIEYMSAITLKTPDYKTIEIIVLPNYEILPPEIDPKL